MTNKVKETVKGVNGDAENKSKKILQERFARIIQHIISLLEA